ncbi:MAG: lytic murein transglycosylase [Candidatus Moranbacteria bacterium]|nr:lytic murein transglycosylase [Candidatus Moranbacteria bacterium]
MKNEIKKNTILSIAFLLLVALVPFQIKGVFSNQNFSLVLAEEDADAVKDDIKDLEKKKEKELEAQQRYEGDVNRLQGAVYSTQKDIEATESKIETAEETIKRKEREVEMLNKNIELKKLTLKKMVWEVYYNSEQPLLYLLLRENGLFESITSKDNFLTLKKDILLIVDEIEQAKGTIKKEQEELEKNKVEHEELLWVKEAQKNNLVSEKQVFEKKVEEKRLTVAEIDAKISKLRSTLSSFLGESFDASDIVEAIEFASKKTGVRKEFLMAMLDKESDLGRFTGGCTYKNTRIRDENPDDKSAFKDICEELDYDYKKMKVSCALSYGYGGAMGIAQFMPTTWNGYRDRITRYTGHNPPDPWDLTDGVVGMAIKLEDAGGDKKSGEYKAAAMYYCGGNWNRDVCHNYASTVISWSSGYDDYF